MDATQFAAAIEQYERTNLTVSVNVGDHVLRYATPSRLCFWRVQTLNSKEPDTIAWQGELPVAILIPAPDGTAHARRVF